MLELSGLSVGYAGSRGAVLANINCAASPGQFICLLGRNGAGKSTLLRTIAGLQRPLSGGVRLDTEDIALMSALARARAISVVLTERATHSGLTTNDVVSLGRAPYTNWSGVLQEADEAKVCEALALAGAAALTNCSFDILSDGERQRVMIARSLAQEGRLMVLDEITAFLDLPGRVEIMATLRRHAHAMRTVVVLSSHDLELSLQLADVVWLVDRAGTLQVGAPRELIDRGVVNAAFDTPEVSFLPAAGRFSLTGQRD